MEARKSTRSRAKKAISYADRARIKAEAAGYDINELVGPKANAELGLQLIATRFYVIMMDDETPARTQIEAGRAIAQILEMGAYGQKSKQQRDKESLARIAEKMATQYERKAKKI